MESLNFSVEENINEFFGKKKSITLKTKIKFLMFNHLGVKEHIVLDKGTVLKKSGSFVLVSLFEEDAEPKKKVASKK